MTITIWQNGTAKDISTVVVSGSIRCNKSLSMDLNKPIGESTLDFEMYNALESDNTEFIPKAGERVRFTLDDGTNTIFFDGFITNPESQHAGFDINGEVLTFKVQAKDVTTLLEQKIMPDVTFTSYTPGQLIDYLAAYADPRITPASDNDSGYTLGEKKIARMNIYNGIEEIAKESGLMVWIDEEWKIHHKLYSTLVGLSQDEKFNISTESLKYKNLQTSEDTSELCTRVHIIGSEMDSGDTNPQNRKTGKQKRTDKIVTKTAPLDDINNIRLKYGFSPLPTATNVENLSSSTVGIIEKDISFQDSYDQTVMERRAIAELNIYSTPWIKGSVNFYEPGLVQGKSILISSPNRDIITALPVIELELTTSENSGFDKSGNRQYYYTATLNGPSRLNQIKKALTPEPNKQAKAELLIKPNPPTIKSHKTTEQIDSVSAEAYGIIITRSEKTYQ